MTMEPDARLWREGTLGGGVVRRCVGRVVPQHPHHVKVSPRGRMREGVEGKGG